MACALFFLYFLALCSYFRAGTLTETLQNLKGLKFCRKFGPTVHGATAKTPQKFSRANFVLRKNGANILCLFSLQAFGERVVPGPVHPLRILW